MPLFLIVLFCNKPVFEISLSQYNGVYLAKSRYTRNTFSEIHTHSPLPLLLPLSLSLSPSLSVGKLLTGPTHNLPFSFTVISDVCGSWIWNKTTFIKYCLQDRANFQILGMANCIIFLHCLCRSSIAQSVCQWAFSLLAIWCLGSQVQILLSAEEHNLSPFDLNIACLCQSIEINNNKYVYIYHIYHIISMPTLLDLLIFIIYTPAHLRWSWSATPTDYIYFSYSSLYCLNKDAPCDCVPLQTKPSDNVRKFIDTYWIKNY